MNGGFGPDEVSADDRKLTKDIVDKIVSDGVAGGQPNEIILNRLNRTTRNNLSSAAINELDKFITEQKRPKTIGGLRRGAAPSKDDPFKAMASAPAAAPVTEEDVKNTADEVRADLVKVFGERDAAILNDVLIEKMDAADVATKYGVSRGRIAQLAGEGKTGQGEREKLFAKAERDHGLSKEYLRNMMDKLAGQSRAAAPQEEVEVGETMVSEGVGVLGDQAQTDLGAAGFSTVDSEGASTSNWKDSASKGTKIQTRQVKAKLDELQSALETAQEQDNEAEVDKLSKEIAKISSEYVTLEEKVAASTQSAFELSENVRELEEKIEAARSAGQDTIATKNNKMTLAEAEAQVAELQAKVMAQLEKAAKSLAKGTKAPKTVAAPKREVGADLAAAKEKFKSVGRDVTKMERAELELLRGEAERFKNKDLLAKIDAQLGNAPAAEVAAPAAAAAETKVEATVATTPKQDSGQTLWDGLRKANTELVAYEDLTDNERGYLTELADRTGGKPKLKDEMGLQELMGRTQDMKFGKDIKDAKAKNPYTAKELLAELKDFIRADIPGRKLLVVDSIEDLLRSPDKMVRAVGAAIALEGAYGVAANGRGYLIANRIQKGAGRAKFMHEVGAHLGLEKLLPKAEYDKLTQQIVNWAKKDDGSTESELALNAVERVQNAGTPKEDRRSELLAYFIEEAMEAGIDPTADGKMSGPLREWFRTLWAAFKTAVRKLGFKPESMNAQDVVNLAFGAARLEINGTWHGTAAAFRKFSNEFMGTGEGAQAYGWGTYLAQRTGIAKGYWSADVDRKTTGGIFRMADKTPITDSQFQRFLNDAQRAGVDTTPEWLRRLESDNKKLLEKYRAAAPRMTYEARSLEYTLTEIGDAIQAGGVKYFEPQQPEGTLMRVDTAMTPDETLDWDRPLSEQPAVLEKLGMLMPQGLQEALAAQYEQNVEDIGELTGEDLYRGLRFLEKNEGAVSEFWGTDEYVGQPGKKVASLFLDSMGIKGIQFLDAKSRGASGDVEVDGKSLWGTINGDAWAAMVDSKGDIDAAIAELKKQESGFNPVYADNATEGIQQLEALRGQDIQYKTKVRTRNLVVFDDKNIFRVGSETAADPQRMKFGKNTPGTGQVFTRALDPVPNQFRGPVKDVLTAVKDASAKGLDYVVFTSDLVDRAIAAGVKSAQTFRDLLVARTTEVRKNEREVERISDMYALVPDKDRQGDRSVNNFLFESTRQGKWGYDSGKFKADPAMANWFNSLDKKSQDFVKAVYQHGNTVLAKKKQTVLKYTETEYDARIANETDPKVKAELEKDKANSLKRFQRLFALREGLPYAPIKRTGSHVVVAMSAAYKAAKKAGDTKLMEKLESDEANYQVTFTNSKWEARRLSERLATDPAYANGDVYLRERDKHQDMLYGGDGVLKSLAKLRTRVENSDDKSSAKMLRMVSDLYLEALAENSARKSEMRRRGIAGDVDMIASFAQQGRADSNFMASVQFGQRIQDSIQAMTNEVKDARDEGRASELRNELLARYEQTMDVQETPWLNRLTRLSSIYWLATSPAYYMQNLTQPWMMSVPAMAGRHNWVAVNAAIFKAYGELKGVVSSGKAFKQNFDLTKVPGDVRDAIQELANRGKIDIGLESEMGEFSAQGQGKVADGINKIDKGLRLAVQKVETINRLSTAMAAYRLELARTKDSKKALDYADRILTDTHGDYTGTNAPRPFNNPVGKVALQFRKFQLIQLTYYAKLLNTIFTDPNERMAAFKMLGYSLGHTALFAGVRGLPGFAAFAFVAAKLLGDDDEPYDLEARMRNAIGDTEMANLIMRGAPTLAGLDISGKVGAGNMLSILPFSNADLTTQQGRSQAAGELFLGAAGGMVSRMADGVGQVLSGDMYRGLESILPKGLGDVLKAGRETTEGMTRRNGDLMLSPEEISYWEALWQGLGVQSVQKSVVYEQQQRVRNMNDNFQERTTRVKNDYAKAVREKDTDAMAEARQAWTKLQEARVRNGYTKQPMSNLLKAPQEQSKREKNTAGGVAFNKQNRGFVESQI